MKPVLWSVLAFAVLSAPALAADGDFRLGVTAGTLGIGPEVGFRPSDHFGLRANATFFSLGHGLTVDDIDYHGKVKLRSFGLMADVFPFGGGFHLSAGARVNGNKARATATPDEPIEIGDTVYDPAAVGTLAGGLKTKTFAPQLTLGFSGKRARGFNFGVEAGALFQGTVRVRPLTLTSTLGVVSQADLDRARADLQDKVDDYKVWPILQLRLGYRF